MAEQKERPTGQRSSSGGVYLLGAGASRGSVHSLPTMGDFFATEDIEAPQFIDLRNVLVRLGGEDGHRNQNLEWVMTYLDLALSSIGPRWAGDALAPEVTPLHLARRALDEFIVRRLRADDTFHAPCDRHVALVRRLSSEDSILTLNYDLIVDRALDRATDRRLGLLTHMTSIPAFQGGEPMAPRPGETSPGLYLKLHGSIDWATCPNVACGNHQHLADMRQAGWENHVRPGLPCRRCGAPLVLGIVTPSLVKEFDRIPKLALLWHLAHDKLARCQRLVVIGVSLAPSDFGLRWLLQHSLGSNPHLEVIEVVNCDPSVAPQFRKLLPRANVQPIERTLEEWIEE